ncbi:hypothetical protein CHARACLAT_033180 [Characodon lateralis]|uniref:Uncharacterized protein n=1 Tax=Characodon lateralis TaxID=208331 RepID=A0ABU7E5P9_9TELE|nr:hypothetical protein [Characodon lateralis]
MLFQVSTSPESADQNKTQYLYSGLSCFCVTAALQRSLWGKELFKYSGNKHLYSTLQFSCNLKHILPVKMLYSLFQFQLYQNINTTFHNKFMADSSSVGNRNKETKNTR